MDAKELTEKFGRNFQYVYQPVNNRYVQMSDEHQVVLKGLTHSSTGIYHCEISSEAPYFQTVSGESLMTITAVPEESPRIIGLKSVYNEGEWLNVNCTSKLRRASILSWYVNNKKAHEKWVKLYRQEMMPPESVGRDTLMLSFKATPDMFPRCVLSLRCVAKLGSRHWQHQRWALLNTHTYMTSSSEKNGKY
ncbi:uncharacterized protein LOC142323692 [Lycorma delicatula]|uniref:uncharacterized protein LOC142323692 n=1 Tax=Lycorma delicatula TaxID=130591 RepID=UPI003F515AAF